MDVRNQRQFYEFDIILETSNIPAMLTAEDLQNFGFSRSMAYAFLNRKYKIMNS